MLSARCTCVVGDVLLEGDIVLVMSPGKSSSSPDGNGNNTRLLPVLAGARSNVFVLLWLFVTDTADWRLALEEVFRGRIMMSRRTRVALYSAE